MLVAGLALGAFAISLLATLPVQVAARYAAPPVKINGFSGTVWNGSATLDGGHTVTWHVDPWWSLTALGPELDIGVVGPGTELSGHVGLRGLSAEDIRLDALNGRLAWPLLAALVPDLPIGCDAAVTLEDVALRIRAGSPVRLRRAARRAWQLRADGWRRRSGRGPRLLGRHRDQ